MPANSTISKSDWRDFLKVLLHAIDGEFIDWDYIYDFQDNPLVAEFVRKAQG